MDDNRSSLHKSRKNFELYYSVPENFANNMSLIRDMNKICDIISISSQDKHLIHFNIQNKNQISTFSTVKINTYSIKDFTNELMEKLNNYSEEMYKLNPNRVLKERRGYSLKDLSKIWGHWDGYVSEKLLYNKENKNYILSKKNLKELEENLRNKFVSKANHCYDLINNHSDGLLTFDSFITKLRIELGKISTNVATTLEDLALLFGYGYGMMNYIRNTKNYVLSKERITILKKNIKLILGNKAEIILKIVEKYEEKNPNLPEYANQKYTITNPNFFSNNSIEEGTMYWFGWLCSDGWISQPGTTHYKIQLKLNTKDRKIIEQFASTIGYKLDKIRDEQILYEDGNGICKTIDSSRIIFGCKPMWLDLKRLGIFEFKNNGRVPQIIKSLIKKAKKNEINNQLIKSSEGTMALQFLLGFFDGDGNHQGGLSSRILNTKKKFLEEIADLFEIPNEVRKNNNKLIDKKTHRIIWKKRYQLHLGTEIFKQMLVSYKDSLQRKRPDLFKTF